MAWWPIGPVCGACCRQIRASPANCPRCGQHQVLLAAGPGGSRSCGPCAGHPPEFACAACSGTDTSPRRRPCDRCAMNQQLHATLADPVLGIPAQLQPVLAHFGGAGSPRSVAGWLTGMPGGRLLAALAQTAHHRELTHALLDEQPQTSALHHVRDLLVQAGVLPRAMSTSSGSSPGSARSSPAAPRTTPLSCAPTRPGTCCAAPGAGHAALPPCPPPGGPAAASWPP
jgi:hypothetical protein